MHSGSKIDDKDYWDTDDFVPYKEDRHDTFDWKLFRVSIFCDFLGLLWIYLKIFEYHSIWVTYFWLYLKESYKKYRIQLETN